MRTECTCGLILTNESGERLASATFDSSLSHLKKIDTDEVTYAWCDDCYEQLNYEKADARRERAELLERVAKAEAVAAEVRTLGQNLINAVREDQMNMPDPDSLEAIDARHYAEEAIQKLAHVLATNPGIGWYSPEEVGKLRTVIDAADKVLGGRKSFGDIAEYRNIRKKVRSESS